MKIQFIKLKKQKYKYKLIKTFFLKNDNSSLLNKKTINLDYISINKSCITIKSGYEWDGASGAIDTKTVMIPSLIHDALYQCLEIGFINKKNRKKIDKLFYDLCIKNKMNSFRAKYMYLAVRLFYPIYRKL
tara:strand:+ start:19 stop:411 length:393 start_codon:yes stop_codon:yes gene_type:complete